MLAVGLHFVEALDRDTEQKALWAEIRGGSANLSLSPPADGFAGIGRHTSYRMHD